MICLSKNDNGNEARWLLNSHSHGSARVEEYYRDIVWRKEGVTLRKQGIVFFFQSDRMADRRHCPFIIRELLLFRCRTCARPRERGTAEEGWRSERKKKEETMTREGSVTGGGGGERETRRRNGEERTWRANHVRSSRRNARGTRIRWCSLVR